MLSSPPPTPTSGAGDSSPEQARASGTVCGFKAEDTLVHVVQNYDTHICVTKAEQARHPDTPKEATGNPRVNFRFRNF